MTTSPTSYLQTLAKAEAIAFVASLQKVKLHLSHELAWMSQQVQQKTVQLQGIETLLTEAEALGVVNAIPDSTVKPTAATESSTAAAIASGIVINGNDLAALPIVAAPASPDSASNGNAPPTIPTPSAASGLTPPARGKRGAQAATPKNSTAPALQAKPTASGKLSQAAKVSTQPFVQSQFQDQSITDAIGEILKRSRSPLSADDIMVTLYDGLSDEAYKRAKNSVTNILSVGRGKGKWQSTGRGLYANNAVTTA